MLSLNHISKDFFGVRALSDVSIEIRPGEVLAVMGENGAGKSTFIKIACGIYQPDGGTIELDGKEIRLADHSEAMARGISLVSQEIQIVPDATVAENVMLDKLRRFKRFGRIDWQALTGEADRYVQMGGLNVSPTSLCRELSAGKKQLIQIAKCLSAQAKIIFLDEPTSSITSHEANHLFNLIDELRRQQVAVVFVSHKLDEVFQLSDRVVVLRDGKFAGEGPIAELSRDQVISMMIGREFHEERFGRLDYDETAVHLECCDLTRTGMAENISFQLKRGEILGFYGLVGSGRTETARLIIGDLLPERGELRLDGKPVRVRTVAEALHRYRIGYISENRKEKGLILDASVKANLTLPILSSLRRGLSRRIDLGKE
ncbi:MAG: sugar ABC transporter ATP-binding protein, partial [Planctomycetes bacterium]|nr:sugar ABC transporter ATP-binding protein [Planctomycetota bacterium]